jgi:putative ABC transport system substrate-binding protein
MTRRDFITLLSGAAAWPLAARAQQGERMRRIGVLMPLDENDPVAKTYVSAFTQALADLGWTVGRNVRMDLRWPGGDVNRVRALAQELVGLKPDIILTGTTQATVARGRSRSSLRTCPSPSPAASSHRSMSRARGRIDSPSATSLEDWPGRLRRAV